MKKLNIAILGVTGLVGQTMIKVLAESNIEVQNLHLYASSRSEGKLVEFRDKTYVVKTLNELNLDVSLDCALFAVDAAISKLYAPYLTKKGVYVIDNSSAYRMDEKVPLIVPEVNIGILKQDNYLIANPNCSTIQSVVPLHIIDKLFGISEINYTTYQAVSGSGLPGIEDLINGKKGINPTFYPTAIENNIIPQIDSFTESGYTKEELKMINESSKILGINVDINATCVRVPVYVGHTVSIDLKLKKNVDMKTLEHVFLTSSFIKYRNNETYFTPIDVENHDEIFISRLRKHITKNNQISFLAMADNVRKGAASNAVQILSYLSKEFIK